ncbi:MAG: enoyl-CoA hydratase/isomerase family protein [Rhodospirillaceae bacterium]|jgi:enoyl-CoA hydratase|nr:enoyl-CoA hydratase/isomerase family protein [Rhodospirillaceae bacterium]MBT6509474.1 enoyl-CoA hydratase/isomerase family protein [Rhodospirillaceae bacterium]MBT7613526.1 enoyl-CoA hydratase/isomerase family protein [Rhodospirillaceae bacterium]MBT7645957.1 enoyl-CoA hydratase/isomerase family protein [Rhodospirillaceae bacterium]
MSKDVVLLERVGPVSYLTLNRPDSLNAVSEDLRLRFMELIDEADADPESRVVVVRGAGRAFCAGYDIAGDDGGDQSWKTDPYVWRDYLHKCLEFEMRPMDISKPVIASVDGYAVGGGCELAMFCDLTICSVSSKFGEPEIRFSDAGPAMIMPFIIGHKRAREMLYMGDLIDAQTALACGMVNRVVPDDELEDATRKYAERLALIDPEALTGTKLALRRGMEAAGIRTALRAGVDVLAPMYAATTESGTTFEEITKKDGLRAALKWRQAQFAPLP